jgi:hypothetical protein
MFCPSCGSPDQTKNSYCRQCGVFLPDFDDKTASDTSLAGMIRTNNMINGLTAVASFALAALLFLGFSGEKPGLLISMTVGFLIGIGLWQWQSARRNEKIIDHIEKRGIFNEETHSDNAFSDASTAKLSEADFDNEITSSVTEDTTKDLNKIPRR